MHPIRLAAVGVSILAMLGAVPVSAQEGSPPAPTPVVITGTEWCGPRAGGTSSSAAGVESERGWVAECVNKMSDPRVDGTWTNTLNIDCFESGMCVMWGTHVLAGPEGGWDCSWAGAWYEEPAGFNVTGTCPGTGGFEGLTYVFQHGTADFGDGIPYSDDSTFDGVIYEGPAPAIFASAASD